MLGCPRNLWLAETVTGSGHQVDPENDNASVQQEPVASRSMYRIASASEPRLLLPGLQLAKRFQIHAVLTLPVTEADLEAVLRATEPP
jgi:hypothetical protein